MQERFDITDDPYALWEVHVVNRELPAAEKLLAIMPGSAADPEPQFEHVTKLRFHIWTYWMLGQADKLSDALVEFRTIIEKDRQPNGDFGRAKSYLDSAFVAAADGDSDKAEELVRRWRRVESADPAGIMVNQAQACQILAMAGSTVAAVTCIRMALDTPSYMLPYLDLYAPHYDPIRNEQEFIDLLAEIDAGAGTK
jgi:hypothetical protein